MTSDTTDQGPVGGETRRLYRSRTNRQFAGVCAGVAEYLGGDPSFVRLATVVIGLLTGIIPMLILYIVAAIVIPESPEGYVPPAVTAGSGATPARGQGALILGVALIAIGLLALANEVFRVDWDLLWPLGLMALGVLVVVTAAGRR